MMLGYLLGRAGIKTVVLEKHADFCEAHMLKVNAQAMDDGLIMTLGELIAETCATIVDLLQSLLGIAHHSACLSP